MKSLPRYLLLSTGKFLQRMEFFSSLSALVGILGVVLPLIPSENRNAYFTFNELGDLLIYILGILGILIAFIIIFQVTGLALVQWGRGLAIKVEIHKYIQPEDFTHRYVSLKILNNENEDLTDCIVVTEVAERFYNKNDVTDILTNINPNHLSLTWGGGSKGNVISPGNDGIRVLNIGRAEGAKGKFVFIFNNGYEALEDFANAKYHLVIKLNGKLNGEPFKTIRYETCFRLRNYEQNSIQVEFIDYAIALNENLLDLNAANT